MEARGRRSSQLGRQAEQGKAMESTANKPTSQVEARRHAIRRGFGSEVFVPGSGFYGVNCNKGIGEAARRDRGGPRVL
ncbi:unnamed protein product [Calypogeia fissa]